MVEAPVVQLKKLVHECEKIPHLTVVLFNEIMRTRVLTIGAAVAFFLLMSLVPLLMLSFALLSALHLPRLFNEALDLMALMVPPDALGFIRSLLGSLLTTHPAGILSIGALSYLWAATGSVSSLIEALNIAYDVHNVRSWWRDRLQAILLTFGTGGLGIVALLSVLAGPEVIHYLSIYLPIPYFFNLIWSPLRLLLMFSSFVSIVILLYYYGPNRRTTLRAELPGAAFAVVLWFAGSLGLSFYIGHFSNYSATYGSLGAIIILMLWLYLSSISILVGAELNAELGKRRHNHPEGAQSTSRPAPAASPANRPAPTV